MAIIDTQVRTISCDGPECTKSVTYDRREEKTIFELPENVWLRTSRVVQSADGRNHVYCGDECEVAGTATGKHNLPEPKKIIETGNAAAVAIAAKNAAAAQQADAALRSGQPVGGVQLTDGQ